MLAGIGRVWDTVASRSIPIRLRRATKDELSGLDRIRGDRLPGLSLPLKQKCRRWAQDHLTDLREADPDTPERLRARQADIWRPLLAIADAAEGAWPARAREAVGRAAVAPRIWAT